jgi:hypothetical protein
MRRAMCRVDRPSERGAARDIAAVVSTMITSAALPLARELREARAIAS